ncbi:hypothetical protein [Leifsonia shinshuensis]|uniref:hypothetical protein n=1 Tax=Leifsonia shinshuensis TaxID=150026 RepID=UPI0028605AA6|nr:hypothetical protein [Leifsonia shinshuensis]MDR6970156.1 hypothetical protein [Leifsonia shinshuensis]
MSALMAEFEKVQRRRRRVVLLVVLAILAGAGAWMTGPWGVVLLTRGDAVGWLLVAAGALLLAAALVAAVTARRLHVPVESLPGKANPRFGEPEPSRNPNGGYSLVDSQLGSH